MQTLFNNHYTPIIDRLNLDEIKFIVDLYDYITNVPLRKSYSFRSDNIIDMYILNNLIFNLNCHTCVQLYACAYNNNRLTFKLKVINRIFKSNYIEYFAFTDSNKYLSIFLIDNLLNNGDIDFEYLTLLHNSLKNHIETSTELLASYKMSNNEYADIEYDDYFGYIVTTGYDNPSFTLNELINVINMYENLYIDNNDIRDSL